jgi:lipopolysaccharide transport system ATP-binding protein
MLCDDPQLVVSVQGLGKCYFIYDNPADRLKQFLVPRLRKLVPRLFDGSNSFFTEHWALRDISFDIKKGQTVGIIGRNGSGKSTLLQLLCGTLSPTTGSKQVSGRIAALLELGSGFNPEFTGRENVYLNCAVLGLSRDQIELKLEAIFAFADIGKFVDQPVKTYSSGMTLRLAFAVIAHVDADVLIVDEALSVGDAVFTQKCMRFLRRFMKTGTVLFVSHDSSSVLSLCQHVIWLDKGSLVMQGESKKVIEAYTEYTLQEIYGDEARLGTIETVAGGGAAKAVLKESLDETHQVSFFEQIESSEGWETGRAKILKVTLKDANNQLIASFKGGELVKLDITAVALAAMSSPIIGWFVKDRLGQSLFGEHTFTYIDPPLQVDANQQVQAHFEFTLPMLPNGDYSLTVSIAEGTPDDNIQHHWLHDAILIKVNSIKLRYGLVGIPFSNVTLNATSTKQVSK